MSSLFDKLNLRPQERRLVVIVGIVVFVVLNVWLVSPMFGDYGRYEGRITAARKQLTDYEAEIGRKAAYQAELRKLQQLGGFVPTEEAGLRISTEVGSQAAISGVTITSITQMQRNQTTGKTNLYFDEAAVTINFSSNETNLVDFLQRLADPATLIRAKSMTLGTDPGRMRLQGQMTLVKSFQRRPPPKVSAATAATKSSPTPSSAPMATSPKAPATPVQTPATPGKSPAAPATAPKSPATLSPLPGPAPIPAPPPPTGGTNSRRRSMPTPARP